MVRGVLAATCVGAGWVLGDWGVHRETEPLPEVFPDNLLLLEAIGKWLFEFLPSVILTLGGAVLVLFGSAALVSSLVCARCLQIRRARGLCMAIAALHILLPPIGTLLGIATLIVLSRDDVGRAFDAYRDRPDSSA